MWSWWSPLRRTLGVTAVGGLITDLVANQIRLPAWLFPVEMTVLLTVIAIEVRAVLRREQHEQARHGDILTAVGDVKVAVFQLTAMVHQPCLGGRRARAQGRPPRDHPAVTPEKPAVALDAHQAGVLRTSRRAHQG